MNLNVTCGEIYLIQVYVTSLSVICDSAFSGYFEFC